MYCFGPLHYEHDMLYNWIYIFKLNADPDLQTKYRNERSMKAITEAAGCTGQPKRKVTGHVLSLKHTSVIETSLCMNNIYSLSIAFYHCGFSVQFKKNSL